MNSYAAAVSQMKGCSLIPVRKGTKIPAVTWSPYQTRFPAPREILDWSSSRFYGYNVGCVTGAISGVVVLDIDDPAVLPKLQEGFGNGWNDGPMTRTPRGFHFWFKHPGGGIRIPNSANAKEKVDLRGDGGYVVVPPSESGDFAYSWVRPFNRDNLPPFPLAWAGTIFPSIAPIAKELRSTISPSACHSGMV